MKNFFKDFDLNKIIITLAVLAVIIYFVRSWIKKYQEKKEESDAGDLGVKLKKKKPDVDSDSDFDFVQAESLIKNAKGTFNDDETAVYAGFKLPRTKGQMGFLVRYFKDKNGIDLYSFIEGFLNNEELQKVYSIVKNLR